jgi:uncharacterized protein (DUF2236 family)
MTVLNERIPARDWGPVAALPLIVRPPKLRRPREDHGLFGPGSPTWDVWDHPALLIAGARAAAVQMFQPATAAGIYQNSVYQKDPLGRLRRTGDYFTTVAFGDGRAVAEAAERLWRVHSRVRGIEPLTGEPYCATDPENQLWVHVTSWHSALICYERYGPGRLSPEREARFWREAQVASELQGLEPGEVPGSRQEVREYFAQMRPKLCVSEAARDTIDWVLAPPVPAVLKPFEPAVRLLGHAAAATLPRHLRELGHFDYSPLPDALLPLVRVACITMSTPVLNRLFVTLSPEAYAVSSAALDGPPPAHDRTVTIAEARQLLAESRAAA